MEDISWTDREVFHRVKEERNTLHTIKKRKPNWIGHILRRNCILKHVVEGKTIEGTGTREVTCWELKGEALNRTLWRTRFGRGYGRVVIRIT
jgi:hypothetical protein